MCQRKGETKNTFSFKSLNLVQDVRDLPDQRTDLGHCERDSQGSSHKALNLLVKNRD